MKKIDPLLYVTPNDPINQRVLQTARWFNTEKITAQFENVSMGGGSASVPPSVASFFMQNGWSITNVSTRTNVMRDRQTQTSETKQKAGGSTANSSSARGSGSVSGPKWDGGVDSSGSSSVSTGGQSQSSGASVITSSTTLPKAIGYLTVSATRKTLKPDIIAGDMIADLTYAYNDGRQVNNKRYEEIVTLYSLMLGRTEDELGLLDGSFDDYKDLIDQLIPNLWDSLQTFRDRTDGIMDGFGAGQIALINLKFDTLQEQERKSLIGRNMFNSSTWTNAKSGIERDRSLALAGVRDEIAKSALDIESRIVTIKSEIANRVMAAAANLLELKSKALYRPTELRNSVFKSMLDFMERRKDDYPPLGQVFSAAHAVAGQQSIR